MAEINLDELTIRPVLEKDLEILTSWVGIGTFGSSNVAARKLTLEMKHCEIFVAVDRNDVPLSHISFAYFNSFAYIGLYITDPKCRGKGVGSILWKAVMNKIGADRNITLKSTQPMTEKYRQISNFKFTSAIKSLRYVGKMSEEFLEKVKTKNTSGKSYVISPVINKDTVQKVIQYDSKIRGEDTSNFFTVWMNDFQTSLANPNQFIFTVFAKNEDNNNVGYGSIVLNSKFRRVGPVVADNFEIFLLIFKELINYKFVNSNEDNEILTLGVPSCNYILLEFLEEANFRLHSTHDRSFTKQVVDFNYNKIFCFIGLGIPE